MNENQSNNEKSPGQAPVATGPFSAAWWRGLWNNRSSPRVFLPVAGIFLVSAGLSAFVFFGSDYRLKGDLPYLASVIPVENTSFYIEIKNPARLFKIWRQSETGARVTATPAWNALRDGRLSGLQTLLYLLELKAGFAFDDPFDFLKESVGVAFAGEHTLLVARTDLSSRAGIALVQALKGKTINLPGETLVDEKGNRKEEKKSKPPANEEENTDAQIVPESLPVLVERREKLRNLELTVLQSGTKKYYLVLLDEYLFIADDLELLRDALELATGSGSDSLGVAEGMSGARESFAREDGRVLLFVNAGGDSFFAPLAALVGGEQGIAAVMRADEDRTATFDTFSVGKARPGPVDPGAVWKDAGVFFPADAALTILIRDRSPAELLATLEKGEGNAAITGKQLTALLKAGGLAPEGLKQPGAGVALLGLGWTQKRLLPRLVAGLRAEEKLIAGLRHAVFRKSTEEPVAFQEMKYMLANAGDYFRSARVSYGTGEPTAPGFLATDEESLRAVLNARAGNRPDLNDLGTLEQLGEFRDAPVQIVLDVNAARSALREFYLLGAERSDEYTEKTIERDIDPLFAPLAAYRTVHMAHGLNGPVHGRVIIAR